MQELRKSKNITLPSEQFCFFHVNMDYVEIFTWFTYIMFNYVAVQLLSVVAKQEVNVLFDLIQLNNKTKKGRKKQSDSK